MNDHERKMAASINELAIFMGRGSTNVQENEQIQHAITILSNHLVMIVGRRTIKESMKKNG